MPNSKPVRPALVILRERAANDAPPSAHTVRALTRTRVMCSASWITMPS